MKLTLTELKDIISKLIKEAGEVKNLKFSSNTLYYTGQRGGKLPPNRSRYFHDAVFFSNVESFVRGYTMEDDSMQNDSNTHIYKVKFKSNLNIFDLTDENLLSIGAQQIIKDNLGKTISSQSDDGNNYNFRIPIGFKEGKRPLFGYDLKTKTLYYCKAINSDENQILFKIPEREDEYSWKDFDQLKDITDNNILQKNIEDIYADHYIWLLIHGSWRILETKVFQDIIYKKHFHGFIVFESGGENLGIYKEYINPQFIEYVEKLNIEENKYEECIFDSISKKYILIKNLKQNKIEVKLSKLDKILM